MEEKLRQLANRVQALEEENKKLRASTTIPFDVDRAFRERLSPKVSTKSATSENQSVNESGSGSYAVLGDPAGFIEIIIGSITYYIPYYA